MIASLETTIRHQALKLGFDACGFTHAETPTHFPAYQAWIEQGMHGQMHYLERHQEKKGNLQQVLPEVRSVITLAMSYHTREASVQACELGPRGLVARYARHQDYHTALKQPLESLCLELEDIGGAGHVHRAYMDTGPIMERDLATRAGIGFIGKHTNLISRSLGNWFLIAEILTSLELKPDQPEPNRCGHCSRCLDACPTQAIPEPFKLDARRCIAYLTIELKESIPEALRPLIGGRVFGCDDCLAVCPWNRFAREGHLMKSVFRDDLEEADLLKWLELDDASFRKKFRDTPMMRSKRRGLLRNVCVALGNLGDIRSLPALEKAAMDPEPLIAEHAQWAIKQIESRQESNCH